MSAASLQPISDIIIIIINNYQVWVANLRRRQHSMHYFHHPLTVYTTTVNKLIKLILLTVI
jgi:hypothetical protein